VSRGEYASCILIVKMREDVKDTIKEAIKPNHTPTISSNSSKVTILEETQYIP